MKLEQALKRLKVFYQKIKEFLANTLVFFFKLQGLFGRGVIVLKNET